MLGRSCSHLESFERSRLARNGCSERVRCRNARYLAAIPKPVNVYRLQNAIGWSFPARAVLGAIRSRWSITSDLLTQQMEITVPQANIQFYSDAMKDPVLAEWRFAGVPFIQD